jgi:hypothetical protein
LLYVNASAHLPSRVLSFVLERLWYLPGLSKSQLMVCSGRILHPERDGGADKSTVRQVRAPPGARLSYDH